MCIYFFLGTQNCSCSKLWLVLCSNQHLALRRVWRRDIMHTRLLSFLAFSWLFRGVGRPRFYLVRGCESHVGVIICGCICVTTCIFTCIFFFPFSVLYVFWVARPRSLLCRIYYYTPTPYTYKASAFSPHVTRAVLQQLYLVSVPVPKFRFCSHMKIF